MAEYSSEIDWSNLGLKEPSGSGDLSGSALVYATGSTAIEAKVAKSLGTERITFVSPVASTIFSLGIADHHFDAENGPVTKDAKGKDVHATGWKGTLEGITAGTTATIAMAAQKELLFVSTKLPTDGEGTLMAAEAAKKSLEARIKTYEQVAFVHGALETVWFGFPDLTTTLPVVMKGKLAASLWSGGGHDGIGIFHGEHEAIISSDQQVVSAGGYKNVMIGGTIAEVTGGILAEVEGGFAAGVTALAEAELRAVGSVEVLSDFKSELVARKGTAEVLGRLIEIGGYHAFKEPKPGENEGKADKASRYAKTAWRGTCYAKTKWKGALNTQYVAVTAEKDISLGVGEKERIQITEEGVHISGPVKNAKISAGENLTLTNDKAGFQVTPGGVRLHVKPPAPPAPGHHNDDPMLLMIGKFIDQANVIPSIAKGGLLAGAVGFASPTATQALALGAGALASMGNLLSHNLAMKSHKIHVEHTAHDAGQLPTEYWLNIDADNDGVDLDVTHQNFTVKKGTTTLCLGQDSFVASIDGGEAKISVATFTPDALPAARAALAAATAARGAREVALTAATAANMQAFGALNMADPATRALYLASVAAEQQAKTDLQAAVDQVAARHGEVVRYTGTQPGIELKVGNCKLQMGKTGQIKMTNGAGTWEINAAGVISANGNFEVLV